VKLKVNLPFQSKANKTCVLLYSAAYHILGSEFVGYLTLSDSLPFFLQHTASAGTVFSGLAQTDFLAGLRGDR